MNRFILTALVPIALAACSSSESPTPAGDTTGATQGAAGSNAVAANLVSVNVTGMT